MRSVALSLAVLPFVAACSFLLDFDELARDRDRVIDGGNGSNRDATASGGAAGKDATVDVNPCAGGCDDHDPCTEDECTPSGCKSTVKPGVVLDGLDEKIPNEQFHRVTMTTLGGRFYLSALKGAEAASDVELRHFGATDSASVDAGDISKLANFPSGIPVSAAGLVPSATKDLVAYVAVGTRPNLAAQVYRLTFDTKLALKATNAAALDQNYLGSRRLYPIAWASNSGTVFGAWPGNPGGVFVHSGTSTLPAGELPALGAAKGQVFALAPLLAGPEIPALLFVADQPYVQGLTQALPFPLNQCDPGPGGFQSATTAFSGITAQVPNISALANIWFGAWTKGTGTSVSTEYKAVICTSAGCLGDVKCEPKQRLAGTRNPAITFGTIQGGPATRGYELVATPYISGAKAGINLAATQLDFDTTADASVGTTPIGDPLTLSEGPVGAAGAGPDFPAIAFSGPNNIGVAWIEPAPAGSTGDVLRIQRQRLCLPK